MGEKSHCLFLQLLCLNRANSKTGRDADTQPDQTTLCSGHLNRRCERLVSDSTQDFVVISSVGLSIGLKHRPVFAVKIFCPVDGSTSTDDQLQQDVPSALSW
ncbi:hypothetical protein PGT21_036913 [Puccinia graminis f. sp. tritici]|uniref:Uncharacterized protein n=1 Tax=Puccinia graminis f. sp. tritici TaxID=56615 RepID=A0A5B0R2Z3_PUCGR|nr:hypothetical protein PGT21_036913 [Puccinia graminis f. sp. tritici]